MAKAKDTSSPTSADQDKWRIESDVRTLAEAEAIKKDKARHRKACECARQQMASLKRISNG